MKIERLALTTDFSPRARQAYGTAASLARLTQAKVDLVHCLDFASQYTPTGFGEVMEGAADALRKVQLERLEREAADPLLQGVPVETRVLEGYSTDAIAAFVRERGTDLIVQASHGYTGLKRFFLGSFAERILRTSDVPVLTVKSREGAPLKAEPGFRPRKILFPYDFSFESQKALDAVRFLARTCGSQVLVLYVWRSLADLIPIYGAGGEAVDVELVSFSEDFTGRLLKDLKGFAGRELAGLPHQEEVLTGDPGGQILARASSAGVDLICMATRGWTGLKRAMVGSVAERVLRGAPCPTLTVRS